jgi:uncharacterized repeat protein (TIGR01451 family)
MGGLVRLSLPAAIEQAAAEEVTSASDTPAAGILLSHASFIMRRLTLLVVALLASLAFPGAALGVPGDLLGTVTLPGNGGCSVAGTFDGTFYMTMSDCPSTALQSYQAPPGGNGVATLVSSKSVVDGVGNAVSISALAWDPSRGMVWGAYANQVWLIDIGDPAVSGNALATLQFDAGVGGSSLVDGLAYDGSDDTLYFSPDADCFVHHFSLGTGGNPLGTLLNTITPKNAAGGSDCSVSGVTVGSGNTMYIGRDGDAEIRRIDKTTGDFISQFATTSGRVEDLTCDPITYAPKEAILAKDAYNSLYEAFEVEAGTCPLQGKAADLAMTKADAPDPIALGGTLTYTLTVTNNGPDPSTDSTVTDTLPAGVTFVSATPSQGACSQAAGTVTCTLGSLAVGASATIQIVVTVDATALSPLSDTATVTGVETDPVAANNSGTAETMISPPTELDHFKCYETKQVGTKFDPRQVVLTDEFNTERVNVVRPEAFCTPVDKDGSGINDPTAHLTCYKIHDVRGDEFPKFEKRRVDATDQFGAHSLLLKKIRSLCVPSSKSPAGQVPGPIPTGLDHYKCYKTKQVGTKFEARRVLLTDQFNTERVNVVRPEAFCNPVDKDGSGIKDPAAHLTCYKIRDVRQDEFPKFEPRRVNARDQFGVRDLRVKKARRLCLPPPEPVHPPGPGACVDTDNNGNPDNDGDALCDNWETVGLDGDNDGVADLQLYDLNGDGTIDASEQADLNHKDIYLEIDFMELHQPDAGALADVVAAFAAAPVTNPAGGPGVTLHIQTDEQALLHSDELAFPPCTATAPAGVPDFDAVKAASFGTAAERAVGTQVTSAKRFAFHYSLFVHNLLGLDGTSGCAEIFGNDFVVSLGSWSSVGGHPVGTRDEQAGTLMHEFGHNLNLRHGGADDINCKPNYLSVMTYTRQINGAPISGRPLDYSRSALPTLDEASLSEPAGVAGPVGDQTAYGPPFRQVAPADGPIDWNRDSDTVDSGVSADINNVGIGGCAGAGTVLQGHDDWTNLRYDFQNSGDFADGVHLSVIGEREITFAEVQELRGID